MESQIQNADVTVKIIGAAYAVYGELGYRFLERVHRKVWQVERHQAGCTCDLTEVAFKSMVF